MHSDQAANERQNELRQLTDATSRRNMSRNRTIEGERMKLLVRIRDSVWTSFSRCAFELHLRSLWQMGWQAMLKQTTDIAQLD